LLSGPLYEQLFPVKPLVDSNEQVVLESAIINGHKSRNSNL